MSALIAILPGAILGQHRALILVMLVILISGCAMVGPVKEENAKNINHVGVISFLGDDVRIYDYGLTIFERRDRSRIEVPGWKMEKLLQNLVNNELSAHSKFSYVPTSVNRNQLKAVYGKHTDDLWDELDSSRVENITLIAAELKELGIRYNVDTWLLIFPLRNNSPVLFRDLYVKGIGTVRELTGVGRKTAVFSGITIKVVTAENAQVIGNSVSFLWQEIELALWEQANARPENENLESLGQHVKTMLGNQIKASLNKLQLTTEKRGNPQ